MLFQIEQKTQYRYAAKVGFAQHLLRMTPADRPGQRVLSTTLTIEPEPARRIDDEVDFFGNHLVRLDISVPHDRLRVIARSRVYVEPPLDLMPALSPSWDSVREAAMASQAFGGGAPGHFLFHSRLAPHSEAIRVYAEPSFPPGQPILAAVMDLMRRLHADIAYDPDATDVLTTPDEAFAARAGVCQDMSHIMIVALRAMGLPAAYVSGYLRTFPPPGRERLVGADATHAWVQAWCGPELGWRGFDPTNDCPVRDDHIILAIGRDYADASPIDGVIVSSGGHKVSVSVDVAPVQSIVG